MAVVTLFPNAGSRTYPGLVFWSVVALALVQRVTDSSGALFECTIAEELERPMAIGTVIGLPAYAGVDGAGPRFLQGEERQ